MKVGASFVFITVIVKDWVEKAPVESVALIITLFVPTLLFKGVPDKTPDDVFKSNQSGTVGPDNVTVSPTSTSFVVTV